MRERFIPILALVMAVITLTVSWFTITRSLRSGRRLTEIISNLTEHRDHLKKQSSKLEEISGNLSTRFVGDFPGCIDEIVKVIEGAKAGEEITIISDFPGYGIYSNNAEYVKYESVLRRKIHDTHISMVVLNHEQRMEVLRAQFGKSDIKDIKAGAAFKDFIRWARHNEADFQNTEQLCTAIEEQQKKVFELNLDSIEDRCEYDKPLPLLLWIVGDRVAVFSIPNLLPDKGAVEAAFKTEDQGLIKHLKVIAHGYACGSRRGNRK